MPGDTLRDLRDVQFAMVESALLRDPSIPLPLKALYSLLITYGPDRIFPGQETLAKCLGVGRQFINEQLGKLRELQLVTWTQRPGTSNEYEILGYDHYLIEKALTPSAWVSPPGDTSAGGVVIRRQGVSSVATGGVVCGDTIQIHDPDPSNHMGGGTPVNKPGQDDGHLAKLFQKVQSDIELAYGSRNLWLQDAQLVELGESKAVIAVRDEETRQACAGRLEAMVSRILLGALGFPANVRMDVEFTVLMEV